MACGEDAFCSAETYKDCSEGREYVEGGKEGIGGKGRMVYTRGDSCVDARDADGAEADTNDVDACEAGGVSGADVPIRSEVCSISASCASSSMARC